MLATESFFKLADEVHKGIFNHKEHKERKERKEMKGGNGVRFSERSYALFEACITKRRSQTPTSDRERSSHKKPHAKFAKSAKLIIGERLRRKPPKIIFAAKNSDPLVRGRLRPPPMAGEPIRAAARDVL